MKDLLVGRAPSNRTYPGGGHVSMLLPCEVGLLLLVQSGTPDRPKTEGRHPNRRLYAPLVARGSPDQAPGISPGDEITNPALHLRAVVLESSAQLLRGDRGRGWR